MPKKWIQKALKGHKAGALHRQLGIPVDENIMNIVLINLKEAPIGEKVGYFVNGKYKEIKVTPLLKRRANLALNLRRINK